MIGDKPAWWEVLRRCGYPTTVAVIDFECFFSVEYRLQGKDRKGLSTIEYVMDSRYEEIGHACILQTAPFQKPQAVFWPASGPSFVRGLQDEFGSNLERCTVLCQNYNFDGTILARRYGIYPAYPIDLLGLARHEESRTKNDLGSLAERWGLPPKGDTSQFKGLRLAAMTPDQLSAMDTYACHDAWLEWHLFTYLLPRLSNPTVELPLMKHTLECFTRPTLRINQTFATELAGKMRAQVDVALTEVGETLENIGGNKSFSVLLGSALDGAGDAVSRFQKTDKKGNAILAIAKTDDQLAVLRAHPSERVRKLLAARTAIKSWPLHAARVERIAAQTKSSGGSLPVALKYCGAHTGRWSGDEAINLQNLSSRGADLINSIRHMIEPPEGYELVIVDLAAVEARGLAWIAGQNDLVEAFIQGRDIYVEFASKIAKRSLRKSRKTDPPPVKKMLDRMRAMGKIGILGGGYGMGGEKCQAYASTMYGVDLTLSEAINLIQVYRTSVPEITKFWRMVEQKFKAAARYGESSEMPRGLKFHKETDRDIVVITLPSGRELKYHGVRVSIIDGKDSIWMPDKFKKGTKIKMWGGYLTENIVQALCRDFLAGNILSVEATGWHVALHAHDEIVALAPGGQGQKALSEIIGIMSTAPAWAPGCPLGAEGKVTNRYEK